LDSFQGHIRHLPEAGEFGFLKRMRAVSLQEIVNYCDRLLRTREVGDYTGAVNGLQVENRVKVTTHRGSSGSQLVTSRMAIEAKADLCWCITGMFWGASHPWTGARYQLMRTIAG
jgi:hypothetical protein